jgi:hypothetical protein
MDYNKVVILTHQEVISQTKETERVVWMQLAHTRINKEHKAEIIERDLKVNCTKKTPT